jgi:hypothetical protein
MYRHFDGYFVSFNFTSKTISEKLHRISTVHNNLVIEKVTPVSFADSETGLMFIFL